MQLTENCDASTSIGKRGGSTTFESAKWSIEGSGSADEYRLHLYQHMDHNISDLRCAPNLSCLFAEHARHSSVNYPADMDSKHLARPSRRGPARVPTLPEPPTNWLLGEPADQQGRLQYPCELPCRTYNCNISGVLAGSASSRIDCHTLRRRLKTYK